MRRSRWLILPTVALLATPGCSGETTAVPGPTAITITPSTSTSTAIGGQLSLYLKVTDATGKAITGARPSWSSGSPDVVRLVGANPSSAIVEGLRPGTSVITASYASLSASTSITVREPGPAAIISTNLPFTATVGSPWQLSTVVRDSDGVRLTRSVSYATSDPAIAVVSSSGLLVPLDEGLVSISFTADAKTLTQNIRILPGPRGFVWTAADGIVDIGTLPGHHTSTATAVNQSGDVAGTSTNVLTNVSTAFVWSRATGMRALPSLPNALATVATGINNTRMVTGYAVMTPGGVAHAVVWDAGGTIADIGALPESGSSVANAINDSGQVVGSTSLGNIVTRAFLWTQRSGMRLLSDKYGAALAINSRGMVAGSIDQRPVVWLPDGGFASLAVPAGTNTGAATAINERGDIAGWTAFNCDDYYYYFFSCPSVQIPVLWNTDRVPVDLRPDASSTIISVTALNDARQSVGIRGGRAFLRTATGTFIDLGVLGHRTSSAAYALNDAGMVVGRSANP